MLSGSPNRLPPNLLFLTYSAAAIPNPYLYPYAHICNDPIFIKMCISGLIIIYELSVNKVVIFLKLHMNSSLQETHPTQSCYQNWS